MFNENRKIKIDIQYKKQHISYIIIFDLYLLKTSCIIIPVQSSVSAHCFVDHRLYFFSAIVFSVLLRFTAFDFLFGILQDLLL